MQIGRISRIRSNCKIGIPGEPLCVGDVEHIPAKLQLVTFVPRHFPNFTHPKVNIDIPRVADVISRPRLTGICASEILINRGRVAVAKQLWGRKVFRLARAGLDRVDGSYIRLDIPVGGPLTLIIR